MLDQRMHALTAQITKMTPQQRQQFATLHKNDPIIVSMTKYINDQESTLRGVLEAPQALAPKPTVVDETIAGLAGAAAPNLEQMPDGGIAGQPQPPQPPQQPQQPPVQGMAGGGLTGAMGIPIPKSINPFDYVDVSPLMDGEGTSKPIRAAKEKRPSKAELERQKNMAAAGHVGGNTGRPTMENDPRLLGTPPPTEVPPTNAPFRVEVSGAGNKPAPAAPVGGGGGPMPQAPAFGAMDIAGEYNKYMGSLPTDAVAAKEIGDLTAAEVAAAKDNRDRIKADQDSMGIAGLDQEARLRSREATLNKRESDNKGMALLDAGLAMMAGKSQHALVNIGKGALVGTASYRTGLDAIERGRERLDDAFGRLEDIRRGEKRMDAKEMREAEADIRKSANSGMKLLISGIQHRYDVNAKTADSMLRGGIADVVSRREQESRNYATDMGYKAHMGAANIRASVDREGIKQQRLEFDQNRAGGAMAQAALTYAEKRVDGAREHAGKTFQDFTPAMEAQIRTQALNEYRAMNPNAAQYLGSLPQQQAPTGPAPLDPSQWSVRPKN